MVFSKALRKMEELGFLPDAQEALILSMPNQKSEISIQ